jgi:hypothetical protein
MIEVCWFTPRCFQREPEVGAGTESLGKVAENELAGHLPPVTKSARPLRFRGRGQRRSEGKLPKADGEPGEAERFLCVDESPDFVSSRNLRHA